jgi:DNA-binding NarL/FixJ family response regulator
MMSMPSSDPGRRWRILIAEDQAIVREGLAALVGYQADMEVVGSAPDGEEAVRLYGELRPDVTLMDLRMPRRGGLDAITAIRTIDPDAQILVLTTYDGDEDVYRSLQAGARGYLLKDAATEELVGAIRAVARGDRHIPAAVAQRLADRAMAGPPLTEREVEVLRLVAAGKTNKEIATALFIAEGTVKTHLNSIHEKLGVRDRTEAVMVAVRRGILHL